MRQLSARGPDPERTKVDPQLKSGLSGFVIGLGPEDAPDPQSRESGKLPLGSRAFLLVWIHRTATLTQYGYRALVYRTPSMLSK